MTIFVSLDLIRQKKENLSQVEMENEEDCPSNTGSQPTLPSCNSGDTDNNTLTCEFTPRNHTTSSKTDEFSQSDLSEQELGPDNSKDATP